jgi:hypothetical protein
MSKTHWSKTLRFTSSATRLDDIPGIDPIADWGTGLV